MSWTIAQLTSDRPQGAMFLCRDERGYDLGHIYVEEREWPPTRRSQVKYAEITALRVAERHRRKGIGRALIAAAREWAREHGYERISVEASAKQPREAVAFYEAVGMVARSVILDQPVADVEEAPDTVAAAAENPRS